MLLLVASVLPAIKLTVHLISLLVEGLSSRAPTMAA